MTGFRRILIANRGEIACRIIRSVQALGLEAVAVYSEADAQAPHVAMADRAIAIGPAPAAQSYLSIARLIAAARQSGADAVHPGYGFLSERAEFAEACAEAGMIFIGPPPQAIRAMGNKAEAKRLMRAAGVPCVPGYQGDDQSDAGLAQAALDIGLPIMVKAAAGGGGRGMRLVERAADLAQAIATARAEAANAFGSGELILEKAILDARHVEIQIFADRHGHVLHLGERDCSIQRRHQKVIEEAPSPAVSPALRAAMGEIAVTAARAIDYIGAGTIEFLLAPDGAFYFLEMNTRLQVEHPVTELITGLDLVAWQIRVAAGAALPLVQADLALSGHAIEARLYAEDADFLPQSGVVTAWIPPGGAGIRVDHGIASGSVISPYYDPMIAKIIAHGRDREEARHRLIAALERCVILGIETNRRFLIECLEHPGFIDGSATTAFLTRHKPIPPGPPGPGLLALGAALLYRASSVDLPDLLAGWRPSGPATVPMRIALGETRHALEIEDRRQGRFTIRLGATSVDLAILADDGARLRVTLDGVAQDADYIVEFQDGVTRIDLALGRERVSLADVSFLPAQTRAGRPDGAILAPMNGIIASIQVAPGDRVAKGQALVVLEAMKMQHQIAAPAAGTVRAVRVTPGEQVKPRRLLVELALETQGDAT